MVQTKDGVAYEGGMTLYEIQQGLDGYYVSVVEQTHLTGSDHFQTSGSPGRAGFIPNCYASYQAAILEVIQQLGDRITKATAEREEWSARLGGL